MTLSRPSDHFDSPAPDEPIAQPKLGVVGYARFFWRQLTSMRTALFLLLLLAFAAIPGSIVPQRSADPNGVVQFRVDNPDLYPVLDWFQVFNTYTSVWFSAIYLLLFISLIGCVIPRTKHHLIALRARPPKTPARLERLAAFTSRETTADAALSIETAGELLRKSGYRVETYAKSVSAERGYLRETGNLVFHTALIGVLVSVGIGGGFGYTGQRVVVEGQKFVNVLGDYDSFNPGRFFTGDSLAPFRIALDKFTVHYELENTNAIGQATDFTAAVTTTQPGSDPATAEIKVNEPLDIGGTQVYLLGNGYAPTMTVRDPDGKVVWTDSVPFLPQDAMLTSLGVIKVPDGLAEQLGMIAFFYPTAAVLPSGALASAYPDLVDPVLTLQVYSGDLGLDEGVPRSVYDLDLTGLTPLAGGKADQKALQLTIGDTVELPNGLGSIELTGVKRFASFDVHHDPSQLWVLSFALLVIAGLLTSLFIPRRRVWIKAVGSRLEYAGLARGDDPALDAAVEALAERHAALLSLRLKP
jgi:cytochrome c biogenesis protein